MLQPCWRYEGSHDRDGYGRWGSEVVHRIVYRYYYGPIPPTWQVDHLCKVRDCYQPAHLRAVPQELNKATGPRKFICTNGHLRTPDNLYRGGCFECRRDAVRRYQARKKAVMFRRLG